MDLRTRLLLDKIGMVVGFTMFIVGLVGEILGWWDAVGVILSLAGLLAGLFSAMDHNGVALLAGQSTTRTVQTRMVTHQVSMLRNQERMVANHEQMLGNQERMLGNQEQMLGNQERMVGKQEETVALLSRIADTLDERLPGT